MKKPPPQLKDMVVIGPLSARNAGVAILEILSSGTDEPSRAMRLSVGLEPNPAAAAREMMDIGYSCWVSDTGCGCGMWLRSRPAGGCQHAYSESFIKLDDSDAIKWAEERPRWLRDQSN